MHGLDDAISVLYETSRKGILLTWEREFDRQPFRHQILAYLASGPDHRQTNTSCTSTPTKGERHLPGSYQLITADVYRARVLSAPLPIGAFAWYHSYDGS